jgi:hypothetical protein
MQIRASRLILALAAPAALALAGVAAPGLVAQAPPAGRSEQVEFRNPDDGMPLVATLTLPPGEGPFPGLVLVSIADVEELTARLVGSGWAVIRPERRGMTVTERLLRATYQDLANDVRSATAYLAARPEVDAATVGLLGQGDDSPAAALAAIGQPVPAFLVLVSTTGLPGVESFALEQRGLAVERGWDPGALAELDGFVARLGEIVLDTGAPATRLARLTALLGGPGQGLPRSAAFPLTAEGQVRFFSSAIWHDRLAFQPEQVLGRLRSPVLVLTGIEDPFTPPERHLPALHRALDTAPTDDATVCLLPGRTRHTFSREALSVIEAWLGARMGAGRATASATGRDAFLECLDEDFPPG